jgi:hypothetical protein
LAAPENHRLNRCGGEVRTKSTTNKGEGEIDGEEEPMESEGLFFLRKGFCFLEVETFEKLDFSNMKSFF